MDCKVSRRVSALIILQAGKADAKKQLPQISIMNKQLSHLF
jgi:hypothetical protein